MLSLHAKPRRPVDDKELAIAIVNSSVQHAKLLVETLIPARLKMKHMQENIGEIHRHDILSFPPSHALLLLIADIAGILGFYGT